MQLRNWPHELLDLTAQNEYAEDPKLSVLANAVEYLNLQLLKQLDTPVRLLEIGCGAHSRFKDHLKPPSVWEGIDVIDFDRKGNPSIATKRASVDQIPWPADSFDFVVSNQSIEHWYEYGVDIAHGLSEIRRVLKDSGRAVLNFPVHLHGQSIFVTGDFDAIDEQFSNTSLEIETRKAVIKSALPPYQGWRLCGFPDFVVRSLAHHENTSYVVEYVVHKNNANSFKAPQSRSSAKPAKLNPLKRQLHYGLRYFAWKVGTRLIRRGRVQPDQLAHR